MTGVRKCSLSIFWLMMFKKPDLEEWNWFWFFWFWIRVLLDCSEICGRQAAFRDQKRDPHVTTIVGVGWYWRASRKMGCGYVWILKKICELLYSTKKPQTEFCLTVFWGCELLYSTKKRENSDWNWSRNTSRIRLDNRGIRSLCSLYCPKIKFFWLPVVHTCLVLPGCLQAF